LSGLDVLTDVVFYSAKGPKFIKDKAAELGLEGVYFSDRNQDQFIEKVSKVIKSTIRKVQDLNNLRGLVMAEVSELDHMMSEIINKYYDNTDKMLMFHKHVTGNREKSIKKILRNGTQCDKTCTLVWRDQNIEEIKGMDSSQRVTAIHEMLKAIDKDGEIYDKGKFSGDYNKFIIPLRNELAHCESMTDKNGKEILKVKGIDKTFSTEEFKEIRLNIRKFKDLFKELSMRI
jgi:hypothetical protein